MYVQVTIQTPTKSLVKNSRQQNTPNKKSPSHIDIVNTSFNKAGTASNNIIKIEGVSLTIDIE